MGYDCKNHHTTYDMNTVCIKINHFIYIRIVLQLSSQFRYYVETKQSLFYVFI